MNIETVAIMDVFVGDQCGGYFPGPPFRKYVHRSSLNKPMGIRKAINGNKYLSGKSGNVSLHKNTPNSQVTSIHLELSRTTPFLTKNFPTNNPGRQAINPSTSVEKKKLIVFTSLDLIS